MNGIGNRTRRWTRGSLGAVGLAALFFGAEGCTAQVGDGAEAAERSREALTSDGDGFAYVLAGGAVASSSDSMAGTVSVTHTAGSGRYAVTFPGLGGGVFGNGGNAQVVAYGAGGNRCELQGWASRSLDATVNVACVGSNGAAADTAFHVVFTQGPGTPHDVTGGYVWDDQGSRTGTYAPSAQYLWSSTGGGVTSQRFAVGQYGLTFPGVGQSGGNAQVTAYESIPTGAYCKLWISPLWSGTSEYVYVLCFDHAGNPADVSFSARLSFGVSGSSDVFGYATANQDTASSYTPASIFANGSSSAMLAGTTGTGLYWMMLPSSRYAPFDQALMVTAIGGDGTYCNVSSTAPWGTAWFDFVDCYLPSGGSAVPQNSAYDLVQVTDAVIPP